MYEEDDAIKEHGGLARSWTELADKALIYAAFNLLAIAVLSAVAVGVKHLWIIFTT